MCGFRHYENGLERGSMLKKILVTKSSMPPYEEYIEQIKPLWESHWLTNMGCYHNELENKLKEYLQVEELSLLVNGHMSLELAIQAMEFPEGSEVITTPFTFISTTHAIVRNRLKPVFCDVKLKDGTIDEAKIENLITEKTVAIVPVHVYGNLCNSKVIEKIAYQYNLKVIYDAAHAFGIRRCGKSIADLGDASCFSFHATKVFNSIEGGAVVCSERKLYDKLYNLKNFGIRGEELVVEVGANAKMNEFAAAMGLCNLRYLKENIQKRKKLVERYINLIKNISGIECILQQDDEVESNYAYFPIVVDQDRYGYSRDELYDYLKKNNVYSRKYFSPLTADQVCFKNKFREADLDVARSLAKKVLVLPLYADMEVNIVDDIVQMILTNV